MKRTFRQLLRYVLAGGAAFSVDIGAFALLRLMTGTDLIAANIAARLGGAATAFLLNHYWTFAKTRLPTSFSALRYATLWLVATLVSSAGLHALRGLAETPAREILLKIGVEAVLMFANFILCKFWVYQDHANQPRTESDHPPA